MKSKRTIYLVYQAGIANVFAKSANAGKPAECVRLMQSDFRSCEMFARGMGAADEKVRTMACNMAGDIAAQPWSEDLDAQPFSDKFNPVKCN